MARTALAAATLVPPTGVDPTTIDAAANLTDGISYVWSPKRWLYVLNGDSTSLTVTYVTPVTIGAAALALADLPQVITAGLWRLFPPQEAALFRQADGSIHINFAGADSDVMVATFDAP